MPGRLSGKSKRAHNAPDDRTAVLEEQILDGALPVRAARQCSERERAKGRGGPMQGIGWEGGLKACEGWKALEGAGRRRGGGGGGVAVEGLDGLGRRGAL